MSTPRSVDDICSSSFEELQCEVRGQLQLSHPTSDPTSDPKAPDDDLLDDYCQFLLESFPSVCLEEDDAGHEE